MAESDWKPQPGEWHLVIDLGQPASGVIMDEATGKILVPFATQQSVHVAAGKLRLGIVPPQQHIQGEVIIERAEIESDRHG